MVLPWGFFSLLFPLYQQRAVAPTMGERWGWQTGGTWLP